MTAWSPEQISNRLKIDFPDDLSMRISPEAIYQTLFIEDRAVSGHWEGDLIIGTRHSAIGTVVEHRSRTTLLVHLPRLDGYGKTPTVKIGPALAGHGAEAMNIALTGSLSTVPKQLRETPTWDGGKELSGHARLTRDTGTNSVLR